MPFERHLSQCHGRVTAPDHQDQAQLLASPFRREKQKDKMKAALQDTEMKDCKLGECLGRGAFGSVFKAFNWRTGEAVAVKQIKLVDLPKSELRMMESEIDLLKNLWHDNIVKYIGFVKSMDCLNIILEYCENGSLHSILKTYGKFPENLVGLYMTQVLQGLQYLHEQGVIHRDIKGANILTTKDGTVKLADFGVSTSTLAGSQDKEAQVVGTPYWMAPEIIQLSGATSASDIWSVGCTVIELLQGKPPYYHLAAMPALFAIVNDDHPLLPEGISAAARDFLMQCFQKDPNLRISARKLSRHAWIVGCRRGTAPVTKSTADFNQAVEEVKQWNQALKFDAAPRTTTGAEINLLSRSIGVSPAKIQLNLAETQSDAEALRSSDKIGNSNWDNDFASAVSHDDLYPSHLELHRHSAGIMSSERLKSFANTIEDAPEKEEVSEGLQYKLPAPQDENDGCFEPDLQEQTIRPLHRRLIMSNPIESSTILHRVTPSYEARAVDSIDTQEPVKASFGFLSALRDLGGKFELSSRPNMLYREQSVDDYSDLIAENDFALEQKFAELAKKDGRSVDAPQLFHPSDLLSMPKSMQRRNSSANKKPQSRPTVLPDQPMRRTRSSIEIKRFAEDDNEDFSDIFGSVMFSGEERRCDRDAEDNGLMLFSHLSATSRSADEDDFDPFTLVDPDWDDVNLEANIARDRHARLAEKVANLVGSLRPTIEEDLLSKQSEDLLALMIENKEAKNLIISSHGLLPIIEILEPCTVKSRPYIVLQLLKVVNAIILDDVEIQENLCFVGGIPVITKFAARQYSNEIRLEAAAFVRQMYQTSRLTLQMFVSAGGLNILADFLDEDYGNARDLVLIGVNGIWNVFELQGPTPKNDFCRIFSRSKILYPLALVLNRVLDEKKEDHLSELIAGRIVSIFYLFSQAENHVKAIVADRQVLKSVLKDLQRMSPVHQITMLKFIKNLSMLSTTIEPLHSADAIEFLIDVLSANMRKGQLHFREISNQVLNTMYNLCRLSKERQEDAAVGGIIPLLLKIMKTERPPKEFALPILCDMAHSGAKGRRYLWQNKGLDFYISLLTDQYWQVTALDAILVWLQEETANVESHLVDGKFTRVIVDCFSSNKPNTFDSNVLDPLLKLLRLSPSVATSLARPEIFVGINQRLCHKKAVVRLNLLRLVRALLDSCERVSGVADDLQALVSPQIQSLMEFIRRLIETDTALLVRNLASEVLRAYEDRYRSVGPVSRNEATFVGQGSSASSSKRIFNRANISCVSSSLFSSPLMIQAIPSKKRSVDSGTRGISDNEVIIPQIAPDQLKSNRSFSRESGNTLPRRASDLSPVARSRSPMPPGWSQLSRTSLASVTTSASRSGGATGAGELVPITSHRSGSNARARENGERNVGVHGLVLGGSHRLREIAAASSQSKRRTRPRQTGEAF